MDDTGVPLGSVTLAPDAQRSVRTFGQLSTSFPGAPVTFIPDECHGWSAVSSDMHPG